MATDSFTGRKVAEIELLDIFPPSEGEITQYYGRIGQGKTYGATADILDLLRRGNVVYANWRINWDGFDERTSFWYVLLSIILPWRKRFFKFKKENLRYLPVDENFHSTFEKLTDCYVFLDEGHVVFDSYEMAKLSLARRASILHTRHFNRSICIISQRPTAIHVAMRANVNRFYKMEKVWQWGSLIRFRRVEYQEMQNETVDENEEKVVSIKQYWGKAEVFNAYPSKYLRGETKASQTIQFEAFDFDLFSRFMLLLRSLFGIKRASIDSGKVVELENERKTENDGGNVHGNGEQIGGYAKNKVVRSEARGTPQEGAGKKVLEVSGRERGVVLMKKLLAIALLLLGPAYASAAFTLGVSPSVLSDYDAPVVFSGSCDDDYALLVTRPDGKYLQNFTCDAGSGYEWSGSGVSLNTYYSPFGPVDSGLHAFTVLTAADYTTCIDGYEDAEVLGAYGACLPYAQDVIYRNTQEETGISSIVTTAAAGYTATVGSSMGADVSFVGDNFIKLFIGSGVGLLYSLRYWILAIIIIYALVYFSYRAFRFFKK